MKRLSPQQIYDLCNRSGVAPQDLDSLLGQLPVGELNQAELATYLRTIADFTMPPLAESVDMDPARPHAWTSTIALLLEKSLARVLDLIREFEEDDIGDLDDILTGAFYVSIHVENWSTPAVTDLLVDLASSLLRFEDRGPEDAEWVDLKLTDFYESIASAERTNKSQRFIEEHRPRLEQLLHSENLSHAVWALPALLAAGNTTALRTVQDFLARLGTGTIAEDVEQLFVGGVLSRFPALVSRSDVQELLGRDHVSERLEFKLEDLLAGS